MNTFLDFDSSAAGIFFLADRFINPYCPYRLLIRNTPAAAHPPRPRAEGVPIYKLTPQAYKTPKTTNTPTAHAAK